MRKVHSNRRHHEQSVEDILRRLNSPDAGPAWAQFLDIYSGLIMKMASQFEYREDRSNECFLFVCEKLVDGGFRRLLKYDTSSPCTFRSWLGTVVFNLCVDWHRREYGRATLLPAVSALPAFDQAVFRLAIEQGLNKETTFQTLQADFPDLTRESLVSSIERVHALLTPRQRWQITVRNRRRRNPGERRGGTAVDFLPDPGIGPEMEAQKQQELDRLQKALNRLTSSQRLLLSLRFQEGLSLKKIAELSRLGDTNRAWRQLQSALKALFQNMHSDRSEKNRKN